MFNINMCLNINLFLSKKKKNINLYFKYTSKIRNFFKFIRYVHPFLYYAIGKKEDTETFYIGTKILATKYCLKSNKSKDKGSKKIKK